MRARTAMSHSWLLMSFALVLGCRGQGAGGKLQSLGQAGPQVCDLHALETALMTQGVIAALQSDAAACLDDGEPAVVDGPDEGATVAGGSAGSQPEPSGLALAGGEAHRVSLRVIVGWQVMNDLLNEVATRAVHHSGGGNLERDVERLKGQVQAGLHEVRPVLRQLGVSTVADIRYSYDDLYRIVKSRFVDPMVMSYDGIFHRRIHRRYPRGRGLVYRIVTRELARALGEFHARAAAELAAVSDATVSVRLTRVNGSLATAGDTFLTLYLDGTQVGRPVSYLEARQLAATASQELPKVLATPLGQAAASAVTGQPRP